MMLTVLRTDIVVSGIEKEEPPFPSKSVSATYNHIILVRSCLQHLTHANYPEVRGFKLSIQSRYRGISWPKLTFTLLEISFISKHSISTMKDELFEIKDPTKFYHTVIKIPPPRGQEKWYTVM